MPAKKKKAVSKVKKTPKATPAVAPVLAGKCDLEHICDYLQKLSDFLQGDFTTDYKKLRFAVCNLDRKVFGTGVPDDTKRFCKGGTAGEPSEVPKTPIW